MVNRSEAVDGIISTARVDGGITGGDDMQQVAGVLVDMDGTLVDSDAAVERAWADWARAQGLDPTLVLTECHGTTAEATIRRFRPDLDDAAVERETQRCLARETSDLTGVTAASGAREFLDAVAARGLPWAVVTNADRALARARLGAAGIDPPVLVGVDEVRTGKPDPEGYLLGAERIGTPIERCMVVEDSSAGVEAGRRAGAFVVGLRGMPADLILQGLEDVAALLREE